MCCGLIWLWIGRTKQTNRNFANSAQMSSVRPNPDELLAQVQADEAQARRGTLKIFFGYAAGVGKTYAMLATARREKQAGREVVVGYVEPHGRPETEALLDGLEAIPVLQIEHRGVILREFDVDAALARHPDLLLVDELAHTNAIGSRHAKRWQDIEELLAAGINVWTTLNVQHMESLNDVIGQITGITVKETVPDQVFDQTDDLELIDISPEELLERLNAGKVYVPEQAQRALQSFFQKPNLAALRELSLRHAAQRVHSDVETARRQKFALQPWATAERLLVCVGPSPTTARVIRTAKRMATALDATWDAVAVEKEGATNQNAAKEYLARHFRLAERLGAETVILTGPDIAATILDYARSRNVTKILIGKTRLPRWKRLFVRNVVDEVLENSGEIDVYVIHGEEEPRSTTPVHVESDSFDWRTYLATASVVTLAGLIASGLQRFHLADSEANTVMVFLAAVAFVSFRFGRVPAVLASVASVLIFDIFFVMPLYTIAISDTQYIVTFGVMLAIGLVIGTLTARLKERVENARQRERTTNALYQLGKQLGSLSGKVFLASAAGKQIAEITGGEVAIYLSRLANTPELIVGGETSIGKHPVSMPVAQWVIEHDQLAGAGTDTLPNAAGLFLPLTASQQTVGAVAIRVPNAERLLEPDQRRMLEACASQLALALERDELAIEAAEARIQMEAEQVRSTLLSSVSHDLKTPLSAIAGASSSLLESTGLEEDVRRQLLESISKEATHLNRLLENILQMSRLDSGASSPNKQWHVLEEIIGSALHRTRRELERHQIQIDVDAKLPLIFVDGLLLEQLLVNLLENAARYTPPDSTITISASTDGKWLHVVVGDNGPGLSPGEEERIFEKFYRAALSPDAGRGSGLGLAICRAIAKVHGGTITASNRPTGGAQFVLRLPLKSDPPQVLVE